MKLNRATTIYMPGQANHSAAVAELAVFLGAPDAASLRLVRRDLQGSGILLALIGDSAVALQAIGQGRCRLDQAPAGLDAFEVLATGDSLLVLATTPRGLLQGVWQLRDHCRPAAGDGVELPDDLHLAGTFRIPMRIFHGRFDAWPPSRDDLRYIARLGATHCLLTHDWQGDLRSLQAYVHSPIFPRALPPDAIDSNAAHLRRILADCADFGLQAALWITELPCQNGPWVPAAVREAWLSRFPADTLSDSGTYQGKVLCFGHPRVQEYYRDLLGRFFAAFPQVEMLFLFNVDSGGEFCDPASCERCRGVTKIEQRDRLVRFLVQEGQKVRPGLRVLTTGWHWERHGQDFLDRQARLPAASGLYMAAESDGWQCERQVHDMLRQARDICRRTGQLFIGYDDFHWGDDTVHNLNDLQDYPLGIAAKLRRWHELGVDGVFDHWGGWNEDVSSNSVALREFFLDAGADAVGVCRRIAERQFGPLAGGHCLRAWEELEQAHARLSRACSLPPRQWPGWYAGRYVTPTPEGFAAQQPITDDEPLLPKADGDFVYNGGTRADIFAAIGDAWEAAWPHYQAAGKHMEASVSVASDEPLGYADWWSGLKPSPTRRQHLRRQKLYIDSMGLVGREIGLHFALNAIWLRCLEAAPAADAPSRYRAAAESLLRQDIAACLAVAEFFDALRATGDDRDPNRDWSARHRAKARAIEEYLAR